MKIKPLLAAAILLMPLLSSAQITNVNVGTSANDGTGDPLRTAFGKMNSNVVYLSTSETQTNDTRSLNLTNGANKFGGTFVGTVSPVNVIAITNGGTGAASAAAAVTALGAASTTAAQTISGSNIFTGGVFLDSPVRLSAAVTAPVTGVGSITVTFDNNANPALDEGIFVTGSASNTGASFAVDMVGTNFDSTLTHNADGYAELDFGQFVGTPAGYNGGPNGGAGYGDMPGVFWAPIVNQGAIAAGIAEGGNHAGWWVSGNVIDGHHFIVPGFSGSTNLYPHNLTYRNNSSNAFFKAQDVPDLVDFNQDNNTVNFDAGSVVFGNGVPVATTNGTIINASGVLTSSATDGNSVIKATNFIANVRGIAPFALDINGGSGQGLGFEVGTGGVWLVMVANGDVPITAAAGSTGWIGTDTTVIADSSTDSLNSGTSGIYNANCVFWGSTEEKFATKTANYTLAANDEVVYVNGSALTITLPDATAHCSGRIYKIKLIASSTTATVATTSSQHIDGSTSYTLSAQYKYVEVRSDGTQWWITANN